MKHDAVSPLAGLRGAVFALCAAAAALPSAADKKVGVIGLDTSHAIAFTELMNVKTDPEFAGFTVATFGLACFMRAISASLGCGLLSCACPSSAKTINDAIMNFFIKYSLYIALMINY